MRCGAGDDETPAGTDEKSGGPDGQDAAGAGERNQGEEKGRLSVCCYVSKLDSIIQSGTRFYSITLSSRVLRQSYFTYIHTYIA